jgi:hypothetical protein
MLPGSSVKVVDAKYSAWAAKGVKATAAAQIASLWNRMNFSPDLGFRCCGSATPSADQPARFAFPEFKVVARRGSKNRLWELPRTSLTGCYPHE